MADRELRKLKRRELLQMLLVQCEETERLQAELDKTKAELTTLQEGYERLKKKLNVKDERLNQKDAKIAELNSTIEEMQASRVIELEEAGNIAEASLKLNGIFEAAQRAAEQYLINIKRIADSDYQKSEEERLPETVEILERLTISDQIAVPDQKAASGDFTVTDRRMIYGQKIPYESGWRTVSQRKRLHG